MITLLNYQREAVDELLHETYKILRNRGLRDQTKLLLDAPTGSGKTVMTAEYLRRLVEELPDRTDLPHQEFAFLWIAPNELHEQSLARMKQFFADTRVVEPVQFDDLTDNALRTNQVCFFNWQSITREENLLRRANERSRNVESLLANTRAEGIELITILDEAHLYATKGKKANLLLNLLQSAVEIDVSATPYFKQADYKVKVERRAVVDAGMIKKGLVLNPALDGSKQDDEFRLHLVNEALTRRADLADHYRAQGVTIRPLLLIQLPSDKPDDSAEDRHVKSMIEAHLSSERHGITKENGRLAVWLSKERTNLAGIEAFDSPVEVLLFKQAISLGWDCPRAAVLLIFREFGNAEFGVQTVGRILRMPQQRHYNDELLNYGYVYTDLTRTRIVVKEEIQYDVTFNKSFRKADYLQAPVTLWAEHVNTRPVGERNRPTREFYRVFRQVVEEFWGLQKPDVSQELVIYETNKARLRERLIDTDVNQLDFGVIHDTNFRGDVNEVVESTGQTRFRLYQREEDEAFRDFLFSLCGNYARTDTKQFLERALLELLFQDYLSIPEYQAKRVVLHQPQPFRDLINETFQRYEATMEEKRRATQRTTERADWQVPEILTYNEKYVRHPAQKALVEPLYLYDRGLGLVADSQNEQNFIEMLESETVRPHLDWWYKNGSEGREHFSIAYQNRKGKTALFFVDFIIRFQSGLIGLFDPKTLESDPEMVAKHNALVAYLETLNLPKTQAVGGVIVPKSGSWLFCENRIDTNYDTTGWSVFDPANYR